MNRITLTLVILLCSLFASAQQDEFGFPFGKATYADFDLKAYPKDTAAEAFVIKEVGEAHIDYNNLGLLIFTYHVKIKIVKQSAASLANVSILLDKSSTDKEEIKAFRAAAYNLVNNKIEESKIDMRALFFERNGKRQFDVAKFAIPNVREGTVIEYRYAIESPFTYNFRKWEFQSDIPKLYCEYWTVIPANFVYNTTLRGFLRIAERKDMLIPHCIVSSGAEASCVSTRYIMRNVPAFKEEEFMLAKGNYISAMNFELSEYRKLRGGVDKYTKEWKDADLELMQEERFGQQLRKGRNAFEGLFDASILSESDPLKKAMKVYDFVKYRMSWNEYRGAYTDVGVKKAIEDKIGNVADINMALVVALREAGLAADPVMLATRDREQPIEIHPVLNDFNYVIARLTIGDTNYLLDAVDDFLPFGLISESCYNGKGRVIADAGSFWIELKPAERNRIISQVDLKLSKEGVMSGTVTHAYYGYAAVAQRKKMVGFADEKSYLDDTKAKNHTMEFTGYQRTLEDDLSKAIEEKFTVAIPAFDTPEAAQFLFNPNFNNRWETNPFKSETRNFPVDFGVPLERNLTVSVSYPDNIDVTSVPDKVRLALPNNGGRFIYGAVADGVTLTISNFMTISKPVYSTEEYPYLRELFAQKIQTENADIIFRKKK